MGQYSPTKCSRILVLALMLLVVTDKTMLEKAAAARVCKYKLKGELKELEESCDSDECRDYCMGTGYSSGICAGNACYCLSDCD